ncbi:hypothetical protein GH733_014512, partial [Mirounga leonina]
MILGILSSDMGSLRASEAYQQVPARVKAEVKGPQSQDIIAVFLTTLFLQLVRSQGTEAGITASELPSKMSKERGIYSNLLFPYSREQKGKRCPVDKRRDTDNLILQEKMYCCGKSCYYFSREEKTWEKSKESCQDMHSSLIKIDNKEEQ